MLALLLVVEGIVKPKLLQQLNLQHVEQRVAQKGVGLGKANQALEPTPKAAAASGALFSFSRNHSTAFDLGAECQT
jgi:hypothetical protein